MVTKPGQYVEVPDRIQKGGLSLRFASPTFVDAFPEVPKVGMDEYGRISPLAEDAYFREVGAQLRTIIPLHNALSNAFAAWLRAKGFAKVRQETCRVDVEFGSRAALHRAELKTCHAVGTTKAIREALGQLLEYNHYGLRTTANLWWIVIDKIPDAADKVFVETLRTSRGLPLVLAWQVSNGFDTTWTFRAPKDDALGVVMASPGGGVRITPPKKKLVKTLRDRRSDLLPRTRDP